MKDGVSGWLYLLLSENLFWCLSAWFLSETLVKQSMTSILFQPLAHLSPALVIYLGSVSPNPYIKFTVSIN